MQFGMGAFVSEASSGIAISLNSIKQYYDEKYDRAILSKNVIFG